MYQCVQPTNRWAPVDILLNNAGLSRGLDKLHEGLISDWDEMIDTNVKGLLYVTRAVLPGMVTRGRGHVINTGSIAGHEPYPGGNVVLRQQSGRGDAQQDAAAGSARHWDSRDQRTERDA